MKKIIGIGLGLIIAFLIQTSLLKVNLPLLHLIDFFSIFVIYFALNGGEMQGMLTGTVSGLVQDSFTYSIFGISGFSKTALGFFM
ncbi:rod shape-determining protein MreD, partial [Candidatus Aminicenantes bacterium AC-335-O07]|nr:rod shape-determining protein MreD [Candidatus Aminicenantes bacterium AC-335-O07]